MSNLQYVKQVPISLSVIVPARNEEENVEMVLEEFVQTFGIRLKEFEILFYNDASSDKTGEQAEKMARQYKEIRVIHNKTNMNLGRIFSDGIKRARYDYVTYLPCDGEWIGWEFYRLITRYDEADIVIGRTSQRVRPLIRILLSRLYVKIVNLLFKLNLQIYNTPTVVKTEHARSIEIESPGFGFGAEYLVKLIYKGLSYTHVEDLALRKRNSGISTALVFNSWFEVGKSLYRLYKAMELKNESLNHQNRIFRNAGRTDK